MGLAERADRQFEAVHRDAARPTAEKHNSFAVSGYSRRLPLISEYLVMNGMLAKCLPNCEKTRRIAYRAVCDRSADRC